MWDYKAIICRHNKPHSSIEKEGESWILSGSAYVMKESISRLIRKAYPAAFRSEQGMVLAMVVILLLFMFLMATAALGYVYSSNLLTFSKEHRMVALERAEAGLNNAALDLNTLHADLPDKITLPTGYSHAEYVEFLDGLSEDYYGEDTSGAYRYYLTDDMAIIGYGWWRDFKRIVRCEYSEYYFPLLETPAALYIDSKNVNV